MGAAPLVMSGATKRFGAFTAVKALSFDVPQGQIVGFLGPNGAGKSTSLRMALGVMQPDEGSVALFGRAPDIANLRHVGFLPEERGLYKTTDGGESWVKVLEVDTATGVVEIAMHPADPEVLLVATYERERLTAAARKLSLVRRHGATVEHCNEG